MIATVIPPGKMQGEYGKTQELRKYVNALRNLGHLEKIENIGTYLNMQETAIKDLELLDNMRNFGQHGELVMKYDKILGNLVLENLKTWRMQEHIENYKIRFEHM